jgi:flagellar motor protein MotB
MALILTVLRKKNNIDFYDSEYLFQESKGDAKGEDNTSWLITFADLMTILLVFSFVLFVTIHKDKNILSSHEKHPDTNTSFVPTAHAKTEKHAVKTSVPLYIYNKTSTTEQSSTEEKIILKRSVRFDPEGVKLTEGFKSDLNELSALSKKNPSAKIIVSAHIGEPSNLSIKRAKRIIDYLISQCNIEKKRIFVQSLPDNVHLNSIGSKKNMPEEKPIEVKLIKAFWWF